MAGRHRGLRATTEERPACQRSLRRSLPLSAPGPATPRSSQGCPNCQEGCWCRCCSPVKRACWKASQGRQPGGRFAAARGETVAGGSDGALRVPGSLVWPAAKTGDELGRPTPASWPMARIRMAAYRRRSLFGRDVKQERRNRARRFLTRTHGWWGCRQLNLRPRSGYTGRAWRRVPAHRYARCRLGLLLGWDVPGPSCPAHWRHRGPRVLVGVAATPVLPRRRCSNALTMRVEETRYLPSPVFDRT
jgi:hypothetical protein